MRYDLSVADGLHACPLCGRQPRISKGIGELHFGLRDELRARLVSASG
jgi:hypothetical protein